MAGIISKTESTRETFTEAVRQLYGLAFAQPDVMEMIGGAVTDLQQLLDQAVFSESSIGTARKDGPAIRPGCLCIVFTPFSKSFLHIVFRTGSEYWSLLPNSRSPVRKKEDSLAARALNYDYDAVKTIPEKILGKRMEAEDLSQREREWSIQSEFVMLFLVTDYWPVHCLALRRVYSEGANLYEENGRWFFRFHALEVPFRRAAKAPFPQRIVPLLRLYLKYRGDQPGPLLRARDGGAFTTVKDFQPW